jgi:hypothetical protein
MTENASTMENDGISETLGTDVCAGLKNANGEELGDFRVPRLGAFTVFELEPRVVAQFQKVMAMQKKAGIERLTEEEIEKLPDEQKAAYLEKTSEAFANVVSAIYDRDGIQLMTDVLVHTFGGNAPQGVQWTDHVKTWIPKLEVMFDKSSMETVYGYIVTRDFTINDIMQGFSKRFTSMFGGGSKNALSQP